MLKKRSLISLSMIVAVLFSSAQDTNDNDSIETKAVELNELVVKAALVRHDSNSDEYVVTPELSQGATSVYEVLSRLPGVTYNNISNSVSVRMDQSILIEVNGVQVSSEYLQALPVDRLSKIQIVYAPGARYTTDGIRYVINVKLKNDLKGHDLYVGNFAMISAGDNNGDDVVANEQPKIQYIYSGEKVDVTAGYGYGSIHWNYPLSYSRDYTGIASIKSEDVSQKSPNDYNGTHSHLANLGIDWQISPDQMLSLRGTYLNNRINHNSAYNVNQKTLQDGADINYLETSDEYSKDNEISGAVYYQGEFSNGWSVYSALGYDRLRDNLRSEYNGFSTLFDSQYRNTKDYFRGDLDLNYSFNDYVTINFGYKEIWNRYMTFDTERANKISNYKDNRHNGYVFFDWSFDSGIMLHIGTELESIRKNSYENNHNWLKFLPMATVTWLPSENVQLMAEYATKMKYPSLYQVSISQTAIDKWLIQCGNQDLAPSKSQTISLQGSFFDSLIIGAEYEHSQNCITDWYEKSLDDIYYKTFTNARNRKFTAILAYEWTITKGLTWSNTFQWQWEDISRHALTNKASNLSWQSNVEYWIKPIGLLAKVEYLREMQKVPLLQGWQHYGQDLWQISLRKSFIKNSLSVSINYVPPIHTGIRTFQKSLIETSFMNQSQKQNLRTYDNLFMVRIAWRFNKGRNKKRQAQEYDFESEQKQDKGLL